MDTEIDSITEALAGNGVTDDDLKELMPLLFSAAQRSPDPARSLQSFTQWFTSLPTPSVYLARLVASPQVLELFCLVTGCSQYFADLLARNPEYFSVIEEPGRARSARAAAYYYRQVSTLLDVCRQPELKRDVLRRWKAREMLRTGIRDLAGIANMAISTREFSDLADACVQAAYDIACATLPVREGEPPVQMAVIAMGKLGGRELNYSSDIDLMFVHANKLPEYVFLADGRRLESITYYTRLSEAIIRILSDETANGQVFRVDMRLRPEGRFGAIIRSLDSFEAYYESWVETWEFQALLKARFIAGSRDVGHAFMQLIETYVYRKVPSARLREDALLNKRRIEEKCALEGQTETNVKTGYGGIRDVEFIVQLLQLRYGFQYPRVSTPNTLHAIQRLHRVHLLSDTDTQILTSGYILLRNLEHRLQLLNGFQVQTLPPHTHIAERTAVALRMGYSDLSSFELDLSSHRSEIHDALDRLFYGSSSDHGEASADPNSLSQLGTLLDNLGTAHGAERLAALLTAAGFTDIPAAMRALQLAMSGNEFGGMPPDTPDEFKRIAPELIARAARSCAPDAALAGVEAIALAVPNRAQLYAAFDESPDLLDRLIRLAASSPPLLNRLSSHLEWLEYVMNLESYEAEPIPAPFQADVASEERPGSRQILDEMRRRIDRANGNDADIDAISSVFQREALLVGAHEIWEDTDSSNAMRSLTDLADATLQAVIEVCIRQLVKDTKDNEAASAVLESFALIGLGKLGGVELGYASDWDLIAAYEIPEAIDESAAARLAEKLVSQITDAAQKLITRGANVEIDLRLRPWGRSGSLALTPQGYLEYYRSSAETWERQAALKARFVAGNGHTGAHLVRVLKAVSFGHGLSSAEDSEVVAMKKRVESERLKPGDRFTDVKLGYGGLIDIEWIVQRLQMLHGRSYPVLQKSNTIETLSALASCGLLDNSEADLLITAYHLLVRFRNALWLQLGRSQDTIPTDQALLRVLARQLGYFALGTETADQRLVEDITGYMFEARAVFERRFLSK